MYSSNQKNALFPQLIDGGISNVLEAQGYDLNHRLWTASLLEKNPEAIIQTHLAYIRAGAQCIATASYQASIQGLLDAGYSSPNAERLLHQSIHLVDEAIKRAMDEGSIKERPWVAASVGPYGAYLADGSEYKGNYDVSDQVLEQFHLQSIQFYKETNVDVLAFETIPSLQEAKVIAALLRPIRLQSWLSFSCRDEQHLNDGSEIKEAVQILKDHPSVFAMGVNCTHPKYVSGLIKNIQPYKGDKKLIVYPNSGEAYHAESKKWMGISNPDLFVEMTKEWSNLGVDILGGCCRIGPDHIHAMKEALKLHRN